jgi:hypothetical protein
VSQLVDTPNTLDNAADKAAARRPWHAPEFRVIDLAATETGTPGGKNADGNNHHS